MNGAREPQNAGANEKADRCSLLITHANPEDNAFARWLAARLAATGYQVWVDLRSLRGGDDFWDVIEAELKERTVKQIVVISRHVRKRGVMKELAIGDAVGRLLNDPEFMIPVRLEDVPHYEFPPELLRRNAFEAFPNWAAVLAPLLETLAEAGVPRSVGPQPEFLRQMVAAQEDGRLAVLNEPETLLTNWFGFSATPPMLRFFAAAGTSSQLEAWLPGQDSNLRPGD